jgi:8-oxo-dGTP pyrophosphatase MutT (NUDIX family)
MGNSNSSDIQYLDVICIPDIFAASYSEVIGSSNPFSRSNQVGHITASGLVIKNDKILLIFHPYIQQWMQPGGHIDEGEMPVEAAIREVFEETGVVCEPLNENLGPIDIDLHEIPENTKKGEGKHLHIDLLFLLRVLEEGDSPEDIQKTWLPIDQVICPRLQRALQQLPSQTLVT